MGRPDDILKRFGDRVREQRKDEGYSQESFADDCQIAVLVTRIHFDPLARV